MDKKLIEKAIEEFFSEIVHVRKVDWNISELKHEGWNKRIPNLIELLKKLSEGD